MTTAPDFHFSLLENGLDFVLSAIEHLTVASTGQADQKRQLKYAVLHLSSGIELILKERLRIEHWALLFKDVNKADEATYSSGDFVSATYLEVLDRLSGISSVVIDPKRRKQLEDLRKRRNKLEHFGTTESLLSALASTSAMASFIFDFIEDNFDEEQKSEEGIYLAEIQESLGKCNAIVTERWKEIKQSVDGAYATTECPRCGQEAASIDAGEVRCFFCHAVTDGEDAAVAYASRIHGPLGSRERYEHDGDEWPVRRCSECGAEALVLDDMRRGQCFSCGNSWGEGQLTECYDCGELFRDSEDGVGFCAGCWGAKMAKD